MSKEEHITKDGVVLQNLSNGRFSILLENGHKLISYICGKMKKKNRIQVIVGDKVKIEMSLYDPNRGRIVYRYNERSTSNG